MRTKASQKVYSASRINPQLTPRLDDHYICGPRELGDRPRVHVLQVRAWNCNLQELARRCREGLGSLKEFAFHWGLAQCAVSIRWHKFYRSAKDQEWFGMGVRQGHKEDGENAK